MGARQARRERATQCEPHTKYLKLGVGLNLASPIELGQQIQLALGKEAVFVLDRAAVSVDT